MNDAYTQKDIPRRQAPIHLLEPYHLSNGEMLMAIGAKYRCVREEVVSGDELAALARVIDAVNRASCLESSDDTWAPIPIEIVLPRDLAAEDLFLAERLIPKLRERLPLFEAEAVEKVVKVLAAAYRWEIGEGPVPEPVIPADAYADLDHGWVEAYLVYRWTNRDRSNPPSAQALARLAAHHFGLIEDNSSPFVVMAQDVMRFYSQREAQPPQASEADA